MENIKKNFWFLALLFIFISLLGSCGYGPLGTCRTECKSPEFRDSFCGCVKPSSGSIPKPPVYGPFLNFEYSYSQSCGLHNRSYYIVNPTSRDLEVYVSHKLRKGGREGTWYDSPKSSNSLGEAKFIGLEGLEPDCFDQDFLMGTWRDKKTKIDGYLEHAAKVSGIKIDDIKTKFDTKTFVDKKTALNCTDLCSSNPPDASCLILNTPNKDVADKTRENVLSAINSGAVDWNTALQPIFKDTSECKRNEVVLEGSRIVSYGDPCAFPIATDESEKVPSVIVHIPARVTANVPILGVENFETEKKISSRSISESPYIAFRSKVITEEYGGYIESVTATEKLLIYTTNAPACIAISTK